MSTKAKAAELATQVLTETLKLRIYQESIQNVDVPQKICEDYQKIFEKIYASIEPKLEKQDDVHLGVNC